MSRILLGIICGLVFGAIDIGIMLRMTFPDKKAAITAAFIARFGIGFVISAARLRWPGWAVGLCFGLLLSIPDAIITKVMRRSVKFSTLDGRTWMVDLTICERCLSKETRAGLQPLPVWKCP